MNHEHAISPHQVPHEMPQVSDQNTTRIKKQAFSAFSALLLCWLYCCCIAPGQALICPDPSLTVLVAGLFKYRVGFALILSLIFILGFLLDTMRMLYFKGLTICVIFLVAYLSWHITCPVEKLTFIINDFLSQSRFV